MTGVWWYKRGAGNWTQLALNPGQYLLLTSSDALYSSRLEQSLVTANPGNA